MPKKKKIEDKHEIRIKEDRKARSEVILDRDDVYILYGLYHYENLGLDNFKDWMNISHKALLIHINRLIHHEFIMVRRDEEDWKKKLLKLTKKGKMAYTGLVQSPRVRTLINEVRIKEDLEED